MITIAGGIQAVVRIDMTMPGKPEPEQSQPEISPWEQEAYGQGGRFGSMTSIPSGDPSKDRITVSFSGCGYTTAKRLADQGIPVSYISVVGDDPMGMAAVADLERSGVDTSGIITIRELSQQEETEENGVQPVAAAAIPGHLAGSLTSVKVIAKNFLGDTEFWRADERILKELTPQRMQEKADLIRKADLVFADGDLPAEAIRWIAEFCRQEGRELYFDPSSLQGADRGAELLEYFTGIMPGRREAELLSGLDILGTDQLMAAGAHFEGKGIRRIIVTMKGGGIYYKEGPEEGVIRPQRVLRFGETSGAGDVATAALLRAYAEDLSIREAAESAMEAAALYLSDVSDERRY